MISAVGTILATSVEPPSTTMAVSTRPVAPSAAWSSDSAHEASLPRSTELASTRPPTAPMAKTTTAMVSIFPSCCLNRFCDQRSDFVNLYHYKVVKVADSVRFERNGRSASQRTGAQPRSDSRGSAALGGAIVGPGARRATEHLAQCGAPAGGGAGTRGADRARLGDPHQG